jgi:ADP-dependent NAD(P)H-hydrate dehydratase / NAD(P)H-hydrate epimerase
MAALEREAREKFGLDVAALMERAGARTAEVARLLLRERGGRGVVVLAGKGNNGGDGLVAARHLAGDAIVRVVLAAPAAEFRGEPAAHLETLRGRSVSIVDPGALAEEDLDRTFLEADLLVDAIFGTGFRGPAEGLPARVIEAANRSGRPILAVDVPSGVDAATGRADPPCIHAVATVTMGLPKLGLAQYPAAMYAGRLYVADIGFPPALVEGAPIATSLTRASWVDRTLPRRPPDSHKGAFGRVFVVAGARGFTGAAVLAARGAIRAGAGLVTVGIPASVAAVLPAALPEAMTLPLPETPEGTFSERAEEAILEFAAGVSAVAIGPGLTTHPEVVALVRRLLPRLDHPVVVDADGLNALAGEAERLHDAPGPVVITPHPGEMARLLGTTVEDVQRDRSASARDAARRLGVTVVLKGARTVVASPAGQARIIPTGNAAMATGGMGDVLTGVTVALLGQRLAPCDAAACAAYLHGLAGDLAAASRGELGVLAREVADDIPRALARVRAGEVDDGLTIVA